MGLMDKLKGAAGVGAASLEVEIKQRPTKRLNAELKYDFGVRADIEGTADPTFHTTLEIQG